MRQVFTHLIGRDATAGCFGIPAMTWLVALPAGPRALEATRGEARAIPPGDDLGLKRARQGCLAKVAKLPLAPPCPHSRQSEGGR
jgi:hypothetical protein